MKMTIALLLVVTSIVGLSTACSEKNSIVTIAFSLDSNGSYTGFSNLPKHYTIEDAEKDGCFVMQDLKVIANDELWANFCETAAQGKNTGIRIANFYTKDTNSPYFIDLFFNNGYYYKFYSSSDSQEKQPFLYLLTLEGQDGIPAKDSRAVVLSNDNTLTFYIVMKSMYSSNSEYIQSVSPFSWVILQ